ncbi:hypothetical protein BFP70_06170 [Thioclava sp. SK-1]|uniref:DUF1045 domain-containing protein n=1 Tax=Thioclava sp. SK-1 TaxID=1889770 RepID=UPI000825A427|nr:DUF1045 domain-containing protein [Thioclava sp. SK-1]OCX66285.1 hypothetical protein BFP70_06170 [Thioclava sp. SK-1]
MENYKRYAVYYAPREGDFATKAADWLGWDVENGCVMAHPSLPLPAEVTRSVADLTKAPRKYGFHGTIRAPFRPGLNVTVSDIDHRLRDLAQQVPAPRCPALQLINLHGFLALVPDDHGPLDLFGAAVVKATNDLRAPLTETEIARRRPNRLTERQNAALHKWGYPFVMEDFGFHLTLTGRLKPHEVAPLAEALDDYFAPVLPAPFVIEDLCLFGEDDAGRFHLLHRYALAD